MVEQLKAIALVALASLLSVGCGETRTAPSADGGTGGVAGIGGSAGTGGGGTGGVAGGGGTAGQGGSGGGAGGEGGSGGVVDLCAGVDCNDFNECTFDGTCNPATGACDGRMNLPLDTPCYDGTYICDERAECVQCRIDEQCDDDGNECTLVHCVNNVCFADNLSGPCDYLGTAGVCEQGVCVDADLCDPYPCEDRGECIADQCVPMLGVCNYTYQPLNFPCSVSGGQVCDGDGACVECNDVSHCNDGHPCTYDLCSAQHECSNPYVPDGQGCGTASVCVGGSCISDDLGRQSFAGDRGDLSVGVYATYPGFYNWGLSGFYFNFLGSGVDHELKRIMPSYYADAGGGTAIIMRYYDASGDDSYSWRIDGQELPYGTKRYTHTGCNEYGFAIWETIGNQFFGVPVLLGFDLNRSTDHNLETLEVRVFIAEGGNLIFSHAFEDEGANDYYCYRVDFAIVPASRVIDLNHYRDPVARAGSYTQVLGQATSPVLQGFRLHFTNGDHHVDQIGVRVLPGEARIWFNDKNNDDSFNWEIWWADLL